MSEPDTANTKNERGALIDVLARIDRANADDPNTIEVNGVTRPAELIYGQRMSEALGRLYPDASEDLQIAVRAQHIRRWEVPRGDYPMDKAGYKRWRNDLKRRHGEHAGELMAEAGYPPERIERVGALIRKERLKKDAEAQALEDAACIVFLEHYFADFAQKHDDDKLIGILQKTWIKMSERAQAAAHKLDLEGRPARLMARALSGPA